MTKSMTAYGRGSFGRFSLELHSVNRKGLDVQIFLPKNLLRFDIWLRKCLAAHAQRGQITVRVAIQDQLDGLASSSYITKLGSLKSFWEGIAKDLGYSPEKNIDLPFLLERVASMPSDAQEEDHAIEEALEKAFLVAVEAWKGMKESEGDALARDCRQRLYTLQKLLQEVEKLAPNAALYFRERLKARLDDICKEIEINDERVMREVLILSEKLDVTEEITRIKSHIGQFEELFSSSSNSVGRTMEFLVQEIHREINTLGSKVSDLDIVRLVVEMKSELEKIREQVQNIE